MVYKFDNEDVAAAKAGDQKAALKIINGMEAKIGSSVARVRSSSAEADDLRQAAVLAVLEAIQGFDPERGSNFVSYAEKSIRGAINDCVSQSVSGPSMPDRVRSAIAAGDARGDSREVIAEDLAKNGYHDAAGAFNAYDGTASLGGLEDEPWEPLVVGHEASSTDVVAIREALTALPQREREVLTLLFGFHGNPLTETEVACALGITQQRVNQIKARAINTLQEVMSYDAG